MVGDSAHATDAPAERDTTTALHSQDAPLGEQIIAGVVDEVSGPIVPVEDGFEGRGSQHPQAVAQAHVYRILTGRSSLGLERHLRRYPGIRDRLGLDDVLDHSSFSNSKRNQFDGGTY